MTLNMKTFSNMQITANRKKQSKFIKQNIPNITTKLKLPKPTYQTKSIKTDKFKLALSWRNSTQSCSIVKLF